MRHSKTLGVFHTPYFRRAIGISGGSGSSPFSAKERKCLFAALLISKRAFSLDLNCMVPKNFLHYHKKGLH